MSEESEARHIVIGGGVIGLCSAYFLSREGFPVTVVERDSSRREMCSDKNAGMVVPSHFVPLAAPGVISQGLRWMLNRRSPFFLRPRLDRELWSWIGLFVRHSNLRHVENSRELLRDISIESRRLFEQLSGDLEFSVKKRGLLMLCQTDAGLREELKVAEMARIIGLEAEDCSRERLLELDPEVQMEVKGGVWFPQDCHLDSEEFLSALRAGIVRNGGLFLTGTEVIDFREEKGAVTHAMTTQGHEIRASHVTLAGGAWSPALADKLGVTLPMQAGKGYSFTLGNPKALPRLCSLLKEGRVAVTPMGDSLRVAGTMEICGNDLSVDRVRLSGIVDSFCRFFPEFQANDFEGLKPWSGLRPCSPDGLPYIGPLRGFRNVIVATGHSMLGLSLGPVTGKLVSQIAMNKGIADPRFSPTRFSA